MVINREGLNIIKITCGGSHKRFPNLLLISFCFLLLDAIPVSGQISFITNYEYRIDWEDKQFHQLIVERDSMYESYSSSELIKFDSRHLMYSKNIIYEYIGDLVKNKLCRVFSISTGEELDQSEAWKEVYWKVDIDVHSGGEIRSYDSEEIKSVELKQEWLIDTINFTLSNRVLGITPIRYEEDHGKYGDIQRNTEAVGIYQYMVINATSNSINTQVLAISPVYSVSADGDLRYYRRTFWKIFER